MTLYRHELKTNRKAFLIWMISICMICFGCILLYGSVEESLEEMGDVFANMGAMSAAFGMDKLSINTMTGYYATEIAMIHSLGGAMFAAILGSNLLSKEEYGHTAEFLITLPISRKNVVGKKALAMGTYILLFQVICTLCYLAGFVIMKEEIQWGKILILAATQLLLFLETAGVSFLISAFSKQNRMGVGLGITLVFFTIDIMCRIVPAIKNLRYITPFYFSNAADIFTDTNSPVGCLFVGIVVTVASLTGAVAVYQRKDIAV